MFYWRFSESLSAAHGTCLFGQRLELMINRQFNTQLTNWPDFVLDQAYGTPYAWRKRTGRAGYICWSTDRCCATKLSRDWLDTDIAELVQRSVVSWCLERHKLFHQFQAFVDLRLTYNPWDLVAEKDRLAGDELSKGNFSHSSLSLALYCLKRIRSSSI